MGQAVARRDADVPDNYGPCMLALGDRDRSFVMFFVIHGNAAEASRRAGFGRENSTSETHAKIGYRKLQSDIVQAAVMEEVRRWFHAAAPAAVREVHRILDSPTAKDADKLRAADAVMARVSPVQTNQVIAVEHTHHHRHTLSADEICARLAALAAKVGVDVATLPAPATIEAVPE